jgi:hypothetical protein
MNFSNRPLLNLDAHDLAEALAEELDGQYRIIRVAWYPLDVLTGAALGNPIDLREIEVVVIEGDNRLFWTELLPIGDTGNGRTVGDCFDDAWVDLSRFPGVDGPSDGSTIRGLLNFD